MKAIIAAVIAALALSGTTAQAETWLRINDKLHIDMDSIKYVGGEVIKVSTALGFDADSEYKVWFVYNDINCEDNTKRPGRAIMVYRDGHREYKEHPQTAYKHAAEDSSGALVIEESCRAFKASL